MRKYRAETMAEALAKVKRDLGRDAMILSTRTVKENGWWALGARTLIEIVAEGETSRLPTPARTGKINSARSQSGRADGVAMQTLARLKSQNPSVGEDHFARELQDIKSLVSGLVEQQHKAQLPHLRVELRQAYIRLIQNQVAEEMANRLLREIDALQSAREVDVKRVNELLTQKIASILKPSCPIQLSESSKTKVIALIGPTGVGKTTTVAKLAAHFGLKEKKRVGLITLDTYRIAAVDQLRTYARIIDVPLEVALTPVELKSALRRLSECDVVFIDTAGRSQFDSPKLSELRQFLDVAKPDEIHLVLSSNCSGTVLNRSVETFSKLGANRVIFTKLDEAVGIGTLLSVMEKVEAQLSYVTTGQDVPDDIEVGDTGRLAEMMLSGISGVAV